VTRGVIAKQATTDEAKNNALPLKIPLDIYSHPCDKRTSKRSKTMTKALDLAKLDALKITFEAARTEMENLDAAYRLALLNPEIEQEDEDAARNSYLDAARICKKDRQAYLAERDILVALYREHVTGLDC
jgi:hypothetical protein